MARWSKSATTLLGGTDNNIVFGETITGTDQYYDVLFSENSGITAYSVNQDKTFTVSSSDLLSVGQKITFVNDTSIYTITELSGNQIVLDQQPKIDCSSGCGNEIQFLVDLTDSTFEFKLTPRTATLEDGRNGIEIKSITPVDPTKTITGIVLTDVPGFSLENGQVRLLLTNEILEPVILPLTYSTTQSILLTGYYSVTENAIDPMPAITRKQRVCLKLVTDGFIV